MRRVVVPAIVIVMLIGVGLFSATPLPSAMPAAAQDENPAEMCSEDELLAGENIVRMPSHQDEAWVQAAASEVEEGLYLVVLTMPPDSCIEYRLRRGMIVTVVQEGTILYQAHYDESTDPTDTVEVLKGDDDGSTADDIEVASDTPITVHAGEWITQDRPMWFTFRNAGAGDAVVSVAGYAVPPWGDPCTGGCKTP